MSSIMRRLFCRATLSLLIGASCSLCACSSQAPSTGGAAGGVGTTVGCRPSDGDIYVAGIKKAGTAGRFDFALVGSTPSPPAQGDNLFVVQVIDANGDAAFGELSVTLEMPEHGHPSPKQPEIRFDAEREAFFLDPMRLFMVGLWRITFSFQSSAPSVPLPDSAVFEFCID